MGGPAASALPTNGVLAGQNTVRLIKDVMWVRPIAVDDEEKEIFISIVPDKDSLMYHVYSNDAEQKITHSKGQITYSKESDYEVNDKEAKRYNLDAIKERCHFRGNKKDIYPIYKKIGFDYGPSFQVTEELYSNERRKKK